MWPFLIFIRKIINIIFFKTHLYDKLLVINKKIMIIVSLSKISKSRDGYVNFFLRIVIKET